MVPYLLVYSRSLVDNLDNNLILKEFIFRSILNACLKQKNESMNPTKVKILNAAEYLFATHGYAETSMRQITNRADVNLASVNYHFGSKKALTIEVIDRYLSQLMPNIIDNLKQLQNDKVEPSISAIFSIFKQPLLSLNSINEGGTVYFLKLLGRGYIDSQGHLRGFITQKYQAELSFIRQAFHQSCPALTEEELFWHLHFALGTTSFTLSASDALTDIVKADFNSELYLDDILDRMVPYISAGFIRQGSLNV